MDIDNNAFWRLRLVGGRFASSAIPLDFLKDLSVVGDLVLEVAKDRYLSEHPERQRVRRGFAEGVRFTLVRIDEGSSVPVIALEQARPSLFPERAGDMRYFRQARDVIGRLVGIAEEGRAMEAVRLLPERALPYFERFGRSLQTDEAIEFPVPGQSKAARLTRDSRRSIVMATRASAYSESISIRGRVGMVNRTKARFGIELPEDDRLVEGGIEAPHDGVLYRAFDAYEDGSSVRVEGIGRFDRTGRLIGIGALERVEELDPLDVRTRLEEFMALQDGWLAGHGVAPDPNGVGWLATAFEKWFPDHAELPYLYPTESGGILAEWEDSRHFNTLEIDTLAQKGEWHALRISDGREAEEVFDLEDESGWQRLADRLDRPFGEEQ